MTAEPLKPCDVSYDGYYTGFPEDTKDNCIFLIPEQIGGDETNRATFCLIHGYDFSFKGCSCRKTRQELMDSLGNSEELKAKIRNYIKWIEGQKDDDGYLDSRYQYQIDAFEIVLDWVDELSLKPED